MAPKIIVRRGDITREGVDAIVNPANSGGTRAGGVALAIRKAGGEEIEAEAVERGPTAVGEAISTSAGKLPAQYVIHAPTMEMPAQKINLENVEKATFAALECASKLKIKSLAFPGMGTGVGGVSKKDAARAMVNTIKRFVAEGNSGLDEIILVGFDDELANAFKEGLGKC